MEALNLSSCLGCGCMFGMWGNVVGIRMEKVRLPCMSSPIKKALKAYD